MGISKTGVAEFTNVHESSGMNLVDKDYIGKTFQYTPTTGTNSCITGYVVDFSSCNPGDVVHVSMKFSYKGFDTSNTNGTFSIWTQGDTYHPDTGFTWAVSNPLGGVAPKAALTELVTSGDGETVITKTITLPENLGTKFTKARIGIRSDYSNGTATIAISDLEVIPDKYYTNSDDVSLRIGEDYISASEIYEF